MHTEGPSGKPGGPSALEVPADLRGEADLRRLGKRARDIDGERGAKPDVEVRRGDEEQRRVAVDEDAVGRIPGRRELPENAIPTRGKNAMRSASGIPKPTAGSNPRLWTLTP